MGIHLAAGIRLTLLAGFALAADQGSFDQELAEAQKLLELGKPGAALKAFKRLEDDSHGQHCVPCLLGVAESQIHLHKQADALKSCERALAVPSITPGFRARAHNLRATALLLGSPNESTFRKIENELRLALDADPTDPLAHFTLGYTLLRQRRDPDGVAELRRALELRLPAGMAAEATRLIADPRRARERFAPDFSVVTMSGERVSLESLKGKIVILDFWATWCAPCVMAIPELKELVKKYPPDRLVLLSISVDDDEEAWRDFVTRQRVTWPQYRDSERRLQTLFDVRAFPTYLVLDGEGKVLKALTGTAPQQSVAYRLKETLKDLNVGEAR